MKVLSIKEPYASLIKNGYKFIETRSWKTNYRGELFIHASKTHFNKNNLNNETLNNLTRDMKMNYGNIICRCNLVDCIYMDEKFLEYIHKSQTEYDLGEYKLGRYAWVLKEIEPICPIKAKGKLNIWNFDGEYKIEK